MVSRKAGCPGRGRVRRTREAKAKEVRRPGDEAAGSTEEPLCRLELGPDWNPPSYRIFTVRKGTGPKAQG